MNTWKKNKIKSVMKTLSYNKRSLVVKLLKKGDPVQKSYQIVVCRKQARNKSRLLQLGKVELSKNAQFGFSILKLDIKRLCYLLTTRRVHLRKEILRFILPEYFCVNRAVKNE
jgi:hypothetical protein